MQTTKEFIERDECDPSGDAPEYDSELTTLLNLAQLAGYLGEQARSRLVSMHYGWIKSRCITLLQDHQDAEDAAQEASSSIFRSLSQFQRRSTLKTWMNRIIYNECMTVLRKKQRTMLSDHMESMIQIHSDQLIDNDSAGEDILGGVHRVLNSLAFKSREILLLRFFNECSLEDISIMLNLSISATKMRLYRAMEQYRTGAMKLQVAV